MLDANAMQSSDAVAVAELLLLQVEWHRLRAIVSRKKEREIYYAVRGYMTTKCEIPTTKKKEHTTI